MLTDMVIKVKRIFFFLIKLFGLLLFTFLFIIISIVTYLKSDFNTKVDSEYIESYTRDIQAAAVLPDTFINVFNKVHTIHGTTKELLSWLVNDFSNDCPCLHVAGFRRYYSHWTFTQNVYVIAWKIEKYNSQRECLNYLAQKFDFVNNIIGIENAACFYFNKELENLNEHELIALVVMMENPVLYNPLRRKDLIDKKVAEIMKKF